MVAHKFVLVDVFTEQPLTGNQLAVVLGARGLAERRMQDIAREFNYSETTFIWPPVDAEADWRLRSFSPRAEVFGAGHNALGAWWVLAELGMIALAEPVTTWWQELGGRVLPVEIHSAGGKPRRVAMTQSKPHFGAQLIDRPGLARALGLDSSDFEVEELEAQVVSTGAAHLLAPVRSLSALERVRVDAQALGSLAQGLGCQGCYVFCLATPAPLLAARARGFFPGIGIHEDPATGSAAGPLAAYLASRKRIAEGDWVVIEQGIEMDRPSRIEARVQGEKVEVAGQSVIVAEGSFRMTDR